MKYGFSFAHPNRPGDPVRLFVRSVTGMDTDERLIGEFCELSQAQKHALAINEQLAKHCQDCRDMGDAVRHLRSIGITITEGIAP